MTGVSTPNIHPRLKVVWEPRSFLSGSGDLVVQVRSKHKNWDIKKLRESLLFLTQNTWYKWATTQNRTGTSGPPLRIVFVLTIQPVSIIISHTTGLHHNFLCITTAKSSKIIAIGRFGPTAEVVQVRSNDTILDSADKKGFGSRPCDGLHFTTGS